jgi:hypothetical protein
VYLIGVIPEFLVWLLALTLLLATWKRGSGARLLALAALLVQLASTPLFAGVYAILPRLASSSTGLGGSDLSRLYRFAGLSHSLVAAVAWGLILGAFFSALKAPAKAPG